MIITESKLRKIIRETIKESYDVNNSLNENLDTEVLTEINKAQLKQAAAVLGLSVAALAAKLNIPTHSSVDNKPGVEYPAGVGSFLGSPAKHHNIEYDKLFQDPDVAKIVNNKNLKPDVAAKEILKLDLASKGFSGENLPDYVSDNDGIPAVRNLGLKKDSIFNKELPEQIELYRKDIGIK